MRVIQKSARCLGVVLSLFGFICSCIWGGAAAEAGSGSGFITLASTTSTQNSGLFDHILPKFAALTGIEVRVVAVGTGAALRIARNGDADVLLVHHQPSEAAFVAAGYGVARHPVMYNDFVIIGPAADPAGVLGLTDPAAAFAQIARQRAIFVSRGDDSGTHKRELALWTKTGIDVAAHSGTWYRETGAGMGATINTAAAMGAYTLADRGTWLSFRNRQGLKIVLQNDPSLRNQYGVILVSPQRHKHAKSALGQRFIDWLLSDAGRAAIAGHKIGGQQLFFPG